MTLLFRSAVCAVAFFAMGFSAPAARDDLGAKRSGIERIQAEPDGAGSKQPSEEGRTPGTEAEPGRPSGDEDPNGDDTDSDAHAPTPGEPPGCIFRDQPLDLIV